MGGENKKDNPRGTYPGFLLQGVILLLTFHHLGDGKTFGKKPYFLFDIKKIKLILQFFALSGYAFALGATNMSNLMKNRVKKDEY